MKKKTIYFLILLTMLFCLMACQKEADSTTDKTEENSTEIVDNKETEDSDDILDEKIATDGNANSTDDATTESKYYGLDKTPEDYKEHLIGNEGKFEDGDGSQENPYQIKTAGQLVYLGELFSSETRNGNDMDWNTLTHYYESYYVLTDDIYLNDISDFDNWAEAAPEYIWEPLGSNHFSGHFDGQGHTVYGMYMVSNLNKRNTGDPFYYLGLFGEVSGGEVNNLNVSKSYIRVEGCDCECGGIVGSLLDGTVSGCTSDVTMDIRGASYLGGIVGNSMRSVVEDCIFTGSIHIYDDFSMGGYIGGIVGDFSWDGRIENCINQGTVTVDEKVTDLKSTKFGGIVGFADMGTVLSDKEVGNGTIKNCKNEMDIDSKNACASGIVYWVSVSSMEADLSIESCENYGNISSSGDEGSGGIVGKLMCNYERDDKQSCVIEGCINYGNVTAYNYSGGIVGKSELARAPYSISNCENYGSISVLEDKYGGCESGGIVGGEEASSYEHTITDCVNHGKIYTESGFAGGIVGRYFGFSTKTNNANAALMITKCSNDGEVYNQKENMGTGGILGGVLSEPYGIQIDKCENSGRIYGVENTRSGGIVGASSFLSTEDSKSITVSNCINRGVIAVGSAPKQLDSQRNEDIMKNYKDLDYKDETANAYNGAIYSPSLGGIVGYSKDAYILNCVNLGSFEADENYLIVTDEDIPKIEYVLSKDYPDDDIKMVFTGGIVGSYHNSDDGKKFILNNCFNSDGLAIGLVDVQNVSSDSAFDIKNVTNDEAERIAEDFMK
ncbi:MAG: hypothetical protein IJ141_05130 [Lachnospiraceae bacterium]|nr:hypothetical protein [Lachnospiraceae bacterium]